jgi:hypothetical protein
MNNQQLSDVPLKTPLPKYIGGEDFSVDRQKCKRQMPAGHVPVRSSSVCPTLQEFLPEAGIMDETINRKP